MNRLISFELKKIVKKRTSKIMVAFSFLIILYLFGCISMQEKVFDENGKEYTGLNAISIEKEWYAKISGKMTDESVKADIEAYQNEFNNPANVVVLEDGKTTVFKDEVYWRFVCPKKEYYTLISENYDEPFNYSRFGKLPLIPLDKGFYEARNEKMHKILDQEYLDANYTEMEKEYWFNKNAKIDEPFSYGYAKGWINLINSTGLWLFLVLAICVCMAPVFAGEYQSGMDSLILTSKNGKNKTVTAKIIASVIFGTGIFLLDVLGAIAVVLTPYGIEGWNLPVQIMDTVIPYPLNFLEALSLYVVIAYLIVLAFIMISLSLSVTVRTPYPVLIIDVLVLLIPFFMTYSETNYIYNHIYPLLPTKALEMSLSYYTDYKIGSFIIAWPTMIIICYFLIAVILPVFVLYKFKKHQIK